jgi:predicted NBD/HSP70 family sugar kinase
MMNKIVVDIGGSGVRLGRISDNSVMDVQRVNVSSKEELVSAIMRAAGEKVDAVAISTAGLVNTKDGNHLTYCKQGLRQFEIHPNRAGNLELND